MNTQKYTITNLMLQYIVKYELAIQKIKDIPIPNDMLVGIKDKLQAEEINNLGELIAYPIGYSKAIMVQRGQVLPSYRNKLRIFSNFRNTLDYIDHYDRKSTLKPSIELCTHLNKVLMKYIVDDWDLARARKFSEKPFDMYDTWYKLRDYYPNIDVRSYFNDILKQIANDSTGTHKLIFLAIFIYEMIDKAPFYAGNQITTILVVKAIMKEFGYNPYNLIPISKGIYSIDSDLESAFKMSKNKRDLTIFLEAILYTFSLSAIEASKDFGVTFEEKNRIKKRIGKDLNPRQVKIIEFLDSNEKITRQEYTKMMRISFMTSYRDLQELLKKEYILQKGTGRGTFYILKEENAEEKIRKEKKDEELIQIF